jgi:predicted transcriptional regulator
VKAVLMSIQPGWCKKILDGEKTVEVRKTRPKLETPFKVYIYCAKTAEGWLRTVPVQGWQRLDGFVIGEFTCYKIDTIRRMGIDDNFDYCYLPLNEFGNDDIAIEIRDIKKSLIPKHELNAYGKSAPKLFAWHISELKIYDNPKPLSCFSKHGFSSLFGTSVCGNEDCKYYEPSDDRMVPPTCGLNEYCSLHRPPQSWRYVEELKDETILPVLLQRLSER